MFSEYRITSQYGYRFHPITKVKHFHQGIDMVKGHKSLIGSFTDGVVLYAGVGIGTYGNYVIIRDSKGSAHVYAHLDSVNVRVGNVVTRGQSIGRQGNTGGSTGSHLHYEIRKTHTPKFGYSPDAINSTVEPTKYLKEYYKENLVVDGRMGYLTISAMQRALGTMVDGKISKKSLMIMTWQKLIGAKVTGTFDERTIRKAQQFYGTKEDGKISDPSMLIMEIQRRLNNGTFTNR